jgi:hypothetical protein
MCHAKGAKILGKIGKKKSATFLLLRFDGEVGKDGCTAGKFREKVGEVVSEGQKRDFNGYALTKEEMEDKNKTKVKEEVFQNMRNTVIIVGD